MYYRLIAQCVQGLNNLEGCLDKAERYAQAKKFDVNVLIRSRLAPDMKDFVYQVQSACDYVKAAAAWLSGQTPPRHEDTEKTVDELRARIRKTVAYAESVQPAAYANAVSRKVTLSWAPGKVIGGRRLSAADDDPEYVLPYRDGIRNPAAHRRGCRQDGFLREGQPSRTLAVTISACVDEWNKRNTDG